MAPPKLGDVRTVRRSKGCSSPSSGEPVVSAEVSV